MPNDDQHQYSYTLDYTGAQHSELKPLMEHHGFQTFKEMVQKALKDLNDKFKDAAPPPASK